MHCENYSGYLILSKPSPCETRSYKKQQSDNKHIQFYHEKLNEINNKQGPNFQNKKQKFPTKVVHILQFIDLY